jgi:hypothetical protein
MQDLQELRKQVWNLWCQGKSISDIQRLLSVRIRIGGCVFPHRNLYLGNYGIDPQ